MGLDAASHSGLVPCVSALFGEFVKPPTTVSAGIVGSTIAGTEDISVIGCEGSDGKTEGRVTAADCRGSLITSSCSSDISG